MSKKTDVFPASTVDVLRDELNAAPGAMVQVWHEGHHAFLQVIPPEDTKAALADTPTLKFQPLNDSFICPGDPRCPK